MVGKSAWKKCSWQAQGPQKVGAQPVFLIKNLEGKESGEYPPANQVEVVQPEENANKLSPLFLPAPPSAK